MTEELKSFHYGDEQINYYCIAKDSITNKVIIRVHPDCRVVVSTPKIINESDVLDAIKKRSRWIYKQLCFFREQQQYLSPRQYISGESHYYLGKQYVLKVVESPEEAQGVKLLRGKLEVFVKHKSPEIVKKLITSWYKIRAREIFPQYMSEMLEKALWISERPPLRIQSMKTQWGSCSPKGLISLNYHLLKAPKQFIQYVILHELCHLAEHNHSENFYRLMQQVMPEWETTKERLDGLASAILLD